MCVQFVLLECHTVSFINAALLCETKPIKMNLLLILIFALIASMTVVLLTLVIMYLKDKAVNRKFVRDQIQVDLAVLTESFVAFLSLIIIVREILGPFQSVDVVNGIFMILQCFFDIILACILSLQIVQVSISPTSYARLFLY